MIDECPMTEDCPGFDRDRRVCLLRPGDCEFVPGDAAAIAVEVSQAPAAVLEPGPAPAD